MDQEEKKQEEKKDQPNNAVHGVKLRPMLVYLEKELGWEEMGKRININCFTTNPSMGSSITFLKRNSWAKNEVQELFIHVKTYGKDAPMKKISSTLVAKKSRPRTTTPQKNLSDFINKFNK
jgi:uncharacterized protein (DUF2132 family)